MLFRGSGEKCGRGRIGVKEGVVRIREIVVVLVDRVEFFIENLSVWSRRA